MNEIVFIPTLFFMERLTQETSRSHIRPPQGAFLRLNRHVIPLVAANICVASLVKVVSLSDTVS